MIQKVMKVISIFRFSQKRKQRLFFWLCVCACVQGEHSVYRSEKVAQGHPRTSYRQLWAALSESSLQPQIFYFLNLQEKVVYKILSGDSVKTLTIYCTHSSFQHTKENKGAGKRWALCKHRWPWRCRFRKTTEVLQISSVSLESPCEDTDINLHRMA